MDHILSGIISHIKPFSLKLLWPGYCVKEVEKTNKHTRSLLQLFSVMMAHHPILACHNLESPEGLSEGLSTLTWPVGTSRGGGRVS